MSVLDRVKQVIKNVIPKNKFNFNLESHSLPIDSSPPLSTDSMDKTNLLPDSSLTMSVDAPLLMIENQPPVPAQQTRTECPCSDLQSPTTASCLPPPLLSERQQSVLEKIVGSGRSEQRLIERSKIILAYGSGHGIHQIARELHMDRKTVRKWCSRWNEVQTILQEFEQSFKKISEATYQKILSEVLNDDDRSGAPETFTPEQVTALYAIACEVLDDSLEGVSSWTHKALADEMVKRGIVKSISSSSVGRLLQDADLKPHKTRYWLNSPEKGTDSFRQASQTITTLYQNATELHQQGTHIMSTDEKTGIQAVERLNPTQAMKPHQQSGERREHSYQRHGTQTLIANFEIATGQIIHPTIGQTRTENDFLNHIQVTVNTDPSASWIFVVDQLNTHQSASLVQWVADHCKIKEDLGEKGKEGILQSMNTRKKFLEDASHQIRFIYTPKHASWLNQVEIWFSILTRRLLRRGSFSSVEQLKARMLSFIEFFNKTMAKPFKWIYTGRPLAA
jgi:transposase